MKTVQIILAFLAMVMVAEAFAPVMLGDFFPKKAAAAAKKAAPKKAAAPSRAKPAPAPKGPFLGKIVSKPTQKAATKIQPAAKGVSKQRGFKFGGATKGEFIFEDGLTGLETDLIKRGEYNALTGAAKLRFFYNKGQGSLAKGAPFRDPRA